MANRPTIDQVMLAIAAVLSSRATCIKLKVGCVLTDNKGLILSAGYNGPASGRPHCTDTIKDECYCAGHCQATHAESNAMLSFIGDRVLIDTCYTTHSPCIACCKQLIQTGCERIVFSKPSEEHDKAKAFWTFRSPYPRIWEQKTYSIEDVLQA